MYENMNKNVTIEYDPNILSKIKKIIKEGFDKLKMFITSKNETNFKIYHELDAKFNEITSQLETHEIFEEELDYFLLITDQISYIVYQNCKSNDFGHCEFAVELFDFFIEIWDAKVRLIENFSKKEFEKYNEFLIETKKRYHTFRREFYWNIYEYSEEFDEKETYEFAKSLRE